jgi:hypothetical protein
MTEYSEGFWVTVNGQHIFINGENVNEPSEITNDLPPDKTICRFQCEEPNVSTEEYNSVMWWKGSGFEVIQKAVKTPNDLFKPDREKGLQAAKGIDSVLSKSKIENDVVVYRGISGNTAFNIIKNGTFENKGYTATSVAMGDALGFAQHTPLAHPDGSYQPGRDVQNVIMFKVPKGSSGFYFGRGRESEVLLPRNLKLKCTGVRTYTNGLNVKAITQEGRLRQQKYPAVRIYTMEMHR